jgi:hypothetical protein
MVELVMIVVRIGSTDIHKTASNFTQNIWNNISDISVWVILFGQRLGMFTLLASYFENKSISDTDVGNDLVIVEATSACLIGFGFSCEGCGTCRFIAS